MASKHEGLDVIVEAAKKDPRYSKMRGDDTDDMDDADESKGDSLDEVFSKSQADAIRAAIKAGC